MIGSIFILVKFGSNIPHVFAMIFEYAFTPMAATGGFAGSTVMLAIRWGLARGVYSNEAGTGMAPLAHSSSSANHPVKQGLWGISEVFVDTIIVCTMTALVVLCTRRVDRGRHRRGPDRHCFRRRFRQRHRWHGVRGGHHHLLRLHHRAGQCVLR